MSIRTIFDTCRPRGDVLRGTVAEADFAADLAQVVTGGGSPEYVDPVRFFANTYPTRGLKNLLANVCRRLSGAGGEAAAIFRLDTSYGGGKTHGLIALAHAARGLPRVAGVDEFIDASLLPRGPVRLAAFDGENADPANGRTMGGGVRAHTPWGELAYALAGAAGYDRVRNSDTGGVAPGADTLRELFGGEPTLILLDELSVYLRKVQQIGAVRDQLTAFLTSLFKAVEGTPRAALVYTLAIGKEGRAVDAYSAENQFIADRMAEAESVSARKATLLNPTEEDETAQVLRRRLFEFIDDGAARDAVAAYQAAWSAKREAIADDAVRPETAEAFRAGYPLHPELLQTLTSKTATLDTFQRVRGMLRLLARTIAHLWETRPRTRPRFTCITSTPAASRSGRRSSPACSNPPTCRPSPTTWPGRAAPAPWRRRSTRSAASPCLRRTLRAARPACRSSARATPGNGTARTRPRSRRAPPSAPLRPLTTTHLHPRPRVPY